jgi:hypothetical protein
MRHHTSGTKQPVDFSSGAAVPLQKNLPFPTRPVWKTESPRMFPPSTDNSQNWLYSWLKPNKNIIMRSRFFLKNQQIIDETITTNARSNNKYYNYNQINTIDTIFTTK